MLHTLRQTVHRWFRSFTPDVREAPCHEHGVRHTASLARAELLNAQGVVVERWICPTFRQALREGLARRNARVVARPTWLHEWR